jgi:hypothetical protein
MALEAVRIAAVTPVAGADVDEYPPAAVAEEAPNQVLLVSLRVVRRPSSGSSSARMRNAAVPPRQDAQLDLRVR